MIISQGCALSAHGKAAHYISSGRKGNHLMKKLFSLVLVLILVLSAICVVPASAEDATKLTVSTANLTGTKAKKYAVGDEFVYFVGLNTGTKKQIGNGEGYIEYDSEYLELVDYAGDYDDSEEYAFAPAIRGLSTLISNTNVDGIIKYNFTRINQCLLNRSPLTVNRATAQLSNRNII